MENRNFPARISGTGRPVRETVCPRTPESGKRVRTSRRTSRERGGEARWHDYSPACPICQAPPANFFVVQKWQSILLTPTRRAARPICAKSQRCKAADVRKKGQAEKKTTAATATTKPPPRPSPLPLLPPFSLFPPYPLLLYTPYYPPTPLCRVCVLCGSGRLLFIIYYLYIHTCTLL